MRSALTARRSRCNTLAKAAFYPPIYSAVTTGAIGCTILVVLMVVDCCCREAQGEKAKREAQTAEGAEVGGCFKSLASTYAAAEAAGGVPAAPWPAPGGAPATTSWL